MLDSQRYFRQMVLPGVGAEGQLRLQQARVLMVGAGGLGCPALQYLTAAGVGSLGIVDGDRVEVSNLHRQVLFGQGDCGRPKAEAAAARLSSLNPQVAFQVYPEYLGVSNALEILADYDLVVDGSDNFATKYLVSDAAEVLGKPAVIASVFHYEGTLSLYNRPRASGDLGPSYRCFFPHPPGSGLIPSCAEAGVLGPIPGIVGSYQALEVLKYLLGLPDLLDGRLLMLDLLSGGLEEVNFSRQLPRRQALCAAGDYAAMGAPVAVLGQAELENWQSQGREFCLLDVRESEERLQGHLGGEHVPLGELEGWLARAPQDRPIVVYCQSGVRSQRAVRQLLAGGLSQAFSLEGGYLGRTRVPS